MFDFSGKRALVTGGSRGIGRACARMLADGGARVAVHYHSNRAAADEALASLTGDTSNHCLLQADIGDADCAPRLIAECEEKLGGLDVLINSAGIWREHRIDGVDYDEWQAAWRDILAVNLLGIAHLCHAAVPAMRRSGGGRIVNISSRGAFRGEPTSPAYGASKAGLNALSQSLALYLAPQGIFVAVVAPGWVDTDMAATTLAGLGGAAVREQSPFGRVATAEEVARAALYLAAPGSEFSSGAILDVNGASYLRT